MEGACSSGHIRLEVSGHQVFEPLLYVPLKVWFAILTAPRGHALSSAERLGLWPCLPLLLVWRIMLLCSELPPAMSFYLAPFMVQACFNHLEGLAFTGRRKELAVCSGPCRVGTTASASCWRLVPSPLYAQREARCLLSGPGSHSDTHHRFA